MVNFNSNKLQHKKALLFFCLARGNELPAQVFESFPVNTNKTRVTMRALHALMKYMP